MSSIAAPRWPWIRVAACATAWPDLRHARLGKRNSWWNARRAHGQHLKERAHPRRRDQPLNSSLDVGRLLRVGRHQPRSALSDSHPSEELRLRHWAVDGEAYSARLLRQPRELHVRGEVREAWVRERIGPSVAAHGLQSVAHRVLGRPIVDEECHQWLLA